MPVRSCHEESSLQEVGTLLFILVTDLWSKGFQILVMKRAFLGSDQRSLLSSSFILFSTRRVKEMMKVKKDKPAA